MGKLTCNTSKLRESLGHGQGQRRRGKLESKKEREKSKTEAIIQKEKGRKGDR